MVVQGSLHDEISSCEAGHRWIAHKDKKPRAVAVYVNLKQLYNLLWACWAITAQVSLTSSEDRSTNTTSELLNLHQHDVGLYGRAFVSVCAHSACAFFYTATIYLEGGVGGWWMSSSAEEKRNRDPVQLFHSIEWSVQYIPLCAQKDRAPLQPTVPNLRKKNSTKENEGRGLFSFRALPDMTATMKRVWL